MKQTASRAVCRPEVALEQMETRSANASQRAVRTRLVGLVPNSPTKFSRDSTVIHPLAVLMVTSTTRRFENTQWATLYDLSRWP